MQTGALTRFRLPSPVSRQASPYYITAKINGVTTTNTFSALVAATPSGGTLLFPAGTFHGTSYVNAAITITGAGKGLTIISGIGVNPSGSKACLVPTVNGVTVSNMTFQAFAIDNSLGGNACAVRGDTAGIGATLTNLEITGCQDGILTTSGNWTITGTDFHGNGNGNPFGMGSTHEQYFGADPNAHVVETNVTSACGPLATHAFKSRSGFMTLTNSTYTGNSTDPTHGGNAGAVLDVPHCGALLATNCIFNMPAGSSNPQWLNYGVDNTNNAASGMTASFQNCVFNSGVAGVGGTFQAFQGACTLNVTGSVYTSATAPTFTGWASVIGTMFRGTTATASLSGGSTLTASATIVAGALSGVQNVTFTVAPSGDIPNIAPSGVLSSISWSGGTVTASTATPHGIPTGYLFAANVQDRAYAAGGFAGRYDAIATGTNTFTYAVASNPGTSPTQLYYSTFPINTTFGGSVGDLTYAATSTCSGTAADNTHIVLATGETRACIGHVIQWKTTPACIIVAFNPATHIATVAARAGYAATFTGVPQSGDAYKILAVNAKFSVAPATGTNILQLTAFSPNSGAVNIGPLITSPTCGIMLQGTTAYNPSLPLGIPQSSGSAVCIKNGDDSGTLVDHTAVFGIGCANVWLDNLQIWCVGSSANDGLIIAWNGDSFSFPYTVKLTRINGYSTVETADEAHSAFVQIPADAVNCNFISTRFGQTTMSAGNTGSYKHCTFVNTQGFTTTTAGSTAIGATTINIASATGFPDGGGSSVNNRLFISSQNAGLVGTQKTIQSITGTAVSVDSSVVTGVLPSGTPVFFGPQVQFGGLGPGPTFENCAFFGACAIMSGFSSLTATTCATDVNPQNLSGLSIKTFGSQFTNVYLNESLGGTLDARLKVGNTLQGAGTFDAAVPLDIFGNTRTNPPTIGAIEVPAHSVSASAALGGVGTMGVNATVIGAGGFVGTILFIGDSITAGSVGGATPDNPGFINGMAARGYTVNDLNYGQGGTTTLDWLSIADGGLGWLDNGGLVVGAAATPPATWAMIELGVNDAYPSNRSGRTFTAVEYLSHLTTLANDLVSHGYTVIINQPTDVVAPSDPSLIAQYVAGIAGICNGTTIRQGDTQAYAWSIANKNDLTLFNSDKTHPTVAGAAVLGGFWATAWPGVTGPNVLSGSATLAGVATMAASANSTRLSSNMSGIGTMTVNATVVSGSSYVGPGDVVSGASAWFGLRAYSAAVAATGTQKAVTIRRSSDNTTQDILIKTNGDLDTAAVVSFSSVELTATASISGTTLTFGATQTPINYGDTVTGSGVAPGTVVVNVINLGNIYTVNISQTVASTSMAFTRANYVTKWWDQSGNGRDVTQATAGAQPQLLLATANGSKAALGFAWNSDIEAWFGVQSLTGTGAGISQPYTFSSVVQCTTADPGGTFDDAYLSTFDGGTPGAYAYFNPNYDTNPGTGAYATNSHGVATTASTWYAVQLGFNGASGYVNVSGSATTEDFGTSATSTFLGVGTIDGSARFFIGFISETGIWPSLFSSNGSAMNTNQRAYWGI